jgi:hypothetical protein
VDDAAIVSAHASPEARIALDQTDACTSLGERQRHGEADNAAADYRNIDLVHRSRQEPGLKNKTRPASGTTAGTNRRTDELYELYELYEPTN